MTTNNLIMAFDVETNGLLPKIDRSSGKPLPTISDYPCILQLSFVIYDMHSKKITRTYNQYIKVADNIVISPFITELTGITRKICDEKGILMERALRDFYHAYMSVGKVIAHNLAFDRKMIEIEVQRHLHSIRIPHIGFLFNETFNELNEIDTICTMMTTKNFCGILMTNANGSQWNKNPKLLELHDRLFGFVPENLHNALVDTMVCMRCYLKFTFQIELPLELDAM